MAVRKLLPQIGLEPIIFTSIMCCFTFLATGASTVAGFEPARAKPNRLAADLLNHSDTQSYI